MRPPPGFRPNDATPPPRRQTPIPKSCRQAGFTLKPRFGGAIAKIRVIFGYSKRRRPL